MTENHQYDDDNLEKRVGISNKQKWAAGGLAIFAFFIIILWGWQLKHNLENPLWAGLSKEDILNSEEGDSACVGGNCQIADELDLYTKDTDNDGLSDGDELNVYFTSPYLKDSDSDGYSDWEEITNGKDPNCPAGQDCYTEENMATENSSNSGTENLMTNDLDKQFLELSKDSESYASPGEAKLENILAGEGQADSLRALLLEYGMDEEFLNQISDEELLKTYQEILK